MKKIIILGVTGSIGIQTLEVIDQNPNEFELVGVTAKNNLELLSSIVNKYKPKNIGIYSDGELKCDNYEYNLYRGRTCNLDLLDRTECDLVINALVGSAGLLPTVKTLEKGYNLALANKESLVMAGDYVTKLAQNKKIDILPLDSEHSAIWQCLDFDKSKIYNEIILTCSGGAFRDLDKHIIESLKASKALNHPTWKMGKKVTIDSCTLMNKGFEIIEAMFLFGISSDRIDVVLHKESIIHSMVRFNDGSIIAQLSEPDMRLPIQVAMHYPKRGNCDFKPLDFTKLSLTFARPDEDKFPCLKIAKECANKNDAIRTIMNAANESLVKLYIDDVINFYDIPYYINESLDKLSQISVNSIDEIIDLNDRTNCYIEQRIKKEIR